MRPKEITLTPQSDADGICQSQKPAAGGSQSLTINGALTSGGSATLNHGHLITITSDNADNGRTFTLTGTDFRGYALTEDVTGPNTTTVESTKYFKTITSVVVDDDTAGNITIGANGKSASQIVPLDTYQNPFNIGIGVDISATLTYTIQHTFDDVQISDLSTLKWFNHDDLAAKTADDDGNYAFAIRAVRTLITSFTSGTITTTFIQSGV